MTFNRCSKVLRQEIDESVIYTNSMKMSRWPTDLETFSILDDQYNSNFMGVDVKGRWYFIFGALYRHPNFKELTHIKL